MLSKYFGFYGINVHMCMYWQYCREHKWSISVKVKLCYVVYALGGNLIDNDIRWGGTILYVNVYISLYVHE